MSESRTHAPGPWWVAELPRLDVTPDLIPTAWEATGLCCTSRRQKRPGHEQRQLLRYTKGNTPTRPSLVGRPCASSIVVLRSSATLHELRKGLR